MKRLFVLLVTVLLVTGTYVSASAIGFNDLTDLTDPAFLTPQDLALGLGFGAASGLPIQGAVVYTGAWRAAGVFQGGLADGLGIDSGIVLTTGSLLDYLGDPVESVIVGPNTLDTFNVGTENLIGGDADLNLLAGVAAATQGATLYAQNCSFCHGNLAATTKAGRTAAQIQAAIDANAGGAMGGYVFLSPAEIQLIADALAVPAAIPLELHDTSAIIFNFTSTANRVIIFRFVFGSEEYPETFANDIFGIFLDGVNVATVPGTVSPVSVLALNGNDTPGLFNDNDPAVSFPTPFDSQLDGFSVVLTAAVQVAAGIPHALKIAISDEFDDLADSAVFLAPVTVAQVCAGYSLSPTSQAFASPGGGGSVNVLTQAGCGWTAVSNVPWVTITSAPGGSGNGTVAFAVAPNGTGAARTGTLTIAGQTFTVSQTSVIVDNIVMMITRYYSAILNRAPDQVGLDGWLAEIQRIMGLGIDVKEGFQGLAKSFFNSAEYLLRNTDDTTFVTDLYRAFLNRDPDPGGLAFWVDQLTQGLTRNMLITQFTNSTEFGLILESVFGAVVTRPENNLVNDFYRGFLNRFPDDGGFALWLGQMRAAQCTSAQAVTDLSSQLALSFIQSPEYGLRNRNNSEFVEDLYNAILRRGADPGGFVGWVNQLNTLGRPEVLQSFTASPEFQLRVQDVIAAGCLP